MSFGFVARVMVSDPRSPSTDIVTPNTKVLKKHGSCNLTLSLSQLDVPYTLVDVVALCCSWVFAWSFPTWLCAMVAAIVRFTTPCAAYPPPSD